MFNASFINQSKSNSSNNSNNLKLSSGMSDVKNNCWSNIGNFNDLVTGNGAGGSGNNNNSSNNNNNSSSNNNEDSSHFREAGIIEKLLPSYGFIQCCERQARLFFHYSQFNGNIEHLRLGDPVEFEMTYDRRTGKPIASYVLKISSEAITEEVSTEPVTGFITTEVTDGREGRVAYENRGECFFLPFTREDVETKDITLNPNDRVSFFIAKDKNGGLRARRICLEKPEPPKLQGVICTLKDTFGFIERADVVKEIFFHSSECKDFGSLSLGDDVEFKIQTRYNKEVAVNIMKLSPGSVVFEDCDSVQQTGQILEVIDRSSTHSHASRTYSSSNSLSNSNGADPFPGKIIYRKSNKELEIAYGEKDLKGEFTLHVGDWVTFNLSVDRRDKTEHATNIEFFDENFVLSGEKRDKGFIVAMKDGYGFIKCLNKDGNNLYFKFSEMLDASAFFSLNDEVEFTIAKDNTVAGRLNATRIKLLPNGTIFKNVFEMSVQSYNSCTSPGAGNNSNNSNNSNSDNNADSSGSDNDNNMNNMNNMNNNDRRQSPGSYGFGQVNGFGFGGLSGAAGDANNSSELPLIDLHSDAFGGSASDFTSGMLNVSKLAAGNAASSYGSVASGGKQSMDSWSHMLSLSLDQSLVNGNGANLSNLMLGDAQCDLGQVLKPLEAAAIGDSMANFGDCDASAMNRKRNFELISQTMYDFGNQRNSTGGNVSNCSKNGLKGSGHSNLARTYRGYIVALKESYGFIETEEHSTEVFFHFSIFEGDTESLQLLQEVEYSLAPKPIKFGAGWVRKIANGTIEADEVLSDVMTGVIVRHIRPCSTEHGDYCGLIELKDGDSDAYGSGEPQFFEYSLTSFESGNLINKEGSPVTFQIAITKAGKKRAVNVKQVRERHQAYVDSVKGNFGFLNYEVEEGRRLFFHMSEVTDENSILEPGDKVEFVVIHNKKTGKYSACQVVKVVENSQRPERLMMKLKQQTMDEVNGNKLAILQRQPRGPDGSKGFDTRKKQ